MGTSKSSYLSVTVANLAPSVTITKPTSESTHATGKSLSFSASFSDPGTSDTHTCSISWGDGKTTNGTISQSGGSGTCTASYTYKSDGKYTITVRVVDNSGASRSESVTIYTTKNAVATSGSIVPPASKDKETSGDGAEEGTATAAAPNDEESEAAQLSVAMQRASVMIRFPALTPDSLLMLMLLLVLASLFSPARRRRLALMTRNWATGALSLRAVGTAFSAS